VRDATGQYVIPGLWDMHVHTLLDGREWALSEYVRHGITTVRDMGGQFEAVDSLRRAIAAGRIVGPRIFAAGPMIENADAMRGILANATHDDSLIARHDRLLITNPAEATRAVDSLARLGVDMIKGRDFADVPTYWAIANAARRVGRPFVGHPPPGVNPFALADSGQRSVEHWYYPNELTQLPAAEYDSLVAAYVKHGTAFVPTLRAWHQHRLTVDTLQRELDAVRADTRPGSLRAALLRQWKTDLDSRRTEINGKPATKAQLAGWDRALDGLAQEIGHLAAAGVVILAGSDIPFATYPGEAFQDELRYLVREAGFTPAQALAAGTIAAARFVGVQDSLGTIAEGKIADLVLLDANPLTDIANVRRVAAVMRDGRWVWEQPKSPPTEAR
jgi:imidazolonepropionase-like amidohydrolase